MAIRKIWARIDLSNYTSFSKFWSILTELITEKKKSSIWRKIHGQFCYWLTYNSLQTKFVPFVVGKKASQNFMRKKDDKAGNKTGYKRKDKRKKKKSEQKRIEIKSQNSCFYNYIQLEENYICLKCWKFFLAIPWLAEKRFKKEDLVQNAAFFSPKTGWRQRVKTKLASKNKNKRFVITKIKRLSLPTQCSALWSHWVVL